MSKLSRKVYIKPQFLSNIMCTALQGEQRKRQLPSKTVMLCEIEWGGDCDSTIGIFFSFFNIAFSKGIPLNLLRGHHSTYNILLLHYLGIFST